MLWAQAQEGKHNSAGLWSKDNGKSSLPKVWRELEANLIHLRVDLRFQIFYFVNIMSVNLFSSRC